MHARTSCAVACSAVAAACCCWAMAAVTAAACDAGSRPISIWRSSSLFLRPIGHFNWQCW